MSNLHYPTLKNATFVCNHLPNKPTVQRYVVEDNNDLSKFLKKFTRLAELKSIVKTLKGHLADGKVLVLTDTTMSGFPSYCFEEKGSFERI